MIIVVLYLMPLAAVGGVVFGLVHGRRVRTARRAAYLGEYPSLGYVLAIMDKDKYRTIRDEQGRTGIVHAVRAVMHDFPGMTLVEATEIVDKLD